MKRDLEKKNACERFNLVTNFTSHYLHVSVITLEMSNNDSKNCLLLTNASITAIHQLPTKLWCYSEGRRGGTSNNLSLHKMRK